MGKGDALKKRAAAIGEKLTAVEEKLTNPNIKSDEDDLNYEPKLDHDFTYLAGIVASADAKPTAASVAYYDLLKGQARRDRARSIGRFSTETWPTSIAAVEEAKLPRVAPAPKLEKTP